ncbi:hypothetical protein CDO44_25785 [Pigmentiphaga sp. NML080357]|uniref:LysR family transcriptional regulator n=1 Tax=Pigmentiphaga sp. NML080357 TaxID=2008675 RepID=UPI000B408D0F|nr:LysR family transcriptional regulator [Pigmentiphaga sp. NML080357]OVZ54729.1 hypothetical protein CDO44_25785 [Pigmentiphaga sp. NML080357]
MDINKLDLNLLLVFEALYLERNVTRAGERVGLSQPSMSNALLRLRNQCNDPLFVRTQGGMEPTPYAAELAGNVLRALELVRNGFEQASGFDPASTQRSFTLLMSDFSQFLVLPQLVARFKSSAPGVSLVVSSLSREHYRAALESGDADLAVGNLQELQSGFYQQGLFVDQHVCVMGRGFRKAGAAITLDEYLAARHLVVTANKTDLQIEKELGKQGHRREVALRVPNYLVLPKILAQTDLVVTVPEVIAQAITDDAEGATWSPLPFQTPHTHIRQFWHARYHHDGANIWLRKQIADLHIGASLRRVGGGEGQPAGWSAAA